MKFLKYAAILPIAFSLINVAQAKGEIFYTAPFHGVEINSASKIYVSYGFNSHNQVLVCKSDQANDAITSVEWQYKDASRKIELPVTLKDSSNFAGHFADPQGLLVITNEFDAGTNVGYITVSCEYQQK